MAEPVSPETNPEGEDETCQLVKCDISLHSNCYDLLMTSKIPVRWPGRVFFFRGLLLVS